MFSCYFVCYYPPKKTKPIKDFQEDKWFYGCFFKPFQMKEWDWLVIDFSLQIVSIKYNS